MRVAIDLTALNDNFSGIERYALNMTLEILKQNKDITFDLIFKNEIYPAFFPWKENELMHFHILPGCNKLIFNQWRLPMYLNRLNADYYFFFAFPMPILLKKKHVFGTIHDMCCWDCPETMKKQMAWYFRLSYMRMAKKAEQIITISEFSKTRIREILKVPDDKILVVYCGLSAEFMLVSDCPDDQVKRIRDKYHLPEEPYYLCLSTLEPRKNMMLLLKTYLDLYKSGKVKTRLVLAGRKGWKIDELLSEAEQNGQVIVTGFIDDKDLPMIYKLAKCFIFPSLYEGFGIPPLEAMSQGVPVISSDASSLPEVLGNAAHYFPNNDKDALSKAILYMENEADLKKYAENGQKRSLQFRYEKEAGKIRERLRNDK